MVRNGSIKSTNSAVFFGKLRDSTMLSRLEICLVVNSLGSHLSRSYLKNSKKCHPVPRGSLRETERSEVNAEGISQRDRFANYGRIHDNHAL